MSVYYINEDNELNQNEVFNKFYELGEIIHNLKIKNISKVKNPLSDELDNNLKDKIHFSRVDKSIAWPCINIENWAADRKKTYRLDNRTETYHQTSLESNLQSYIDTIFNYEETIKIIKRRITAIMKKYNYTKKADFVSDEKYYIAYYSLITYILSDLLKAVKDNPKRIRVNYRKKFLCADMTKENLYKFIKEIIKHFFNLKVSIIFDDEVKYIADKGNLTFIVGLKLYALTKEMGYTIEDDNTTYPCIKCGFLFVRPGQEKICSPCRIEDVSIRKKRSDEKLKTERANKKYTG